MDNHQYKPLEFRAGEPILRLKNHENIILTPPRPEDAAAFVDPMNDPRVYEYLLAPPFPYELEDGESFTRCLLEARTDLCEKLDSAKDNPDLILVDDCPVRIIREIQADGSDVFIGDIGFFKYNRGELMTPDGEVDWSLKHQWQDENASRPSGDPRTVWALGDFLVPSHHGRGIMTDVVDTLLTLWGIPRMGIRRMRVDAFIDNPASAKVFLKNGFKSVGTYPEHVEAKGKKRGLHVLERKYEQV